MASTTDYLITGADVVGSGAADILVRDGRIAEIGTGLDVPSGIERVDADGLVALPGLDDLHTHLREPGREDAETIRTGRLRAVMLARSITHTMVPLPSPRTAVSGTVRASVAGTSRVTCTCAVSPKRSSPGGALTASRTAKVRVAGSAAPATLRTRAA